MLAVMVFKAISAIVASSWDLKAAFVPGVSWLGAPPLRDRAPMLGTDEGRKLTPCGPIAQSIKKTGRPF